MTYSDRRKQFMEKMDGGVAIFRAPEMGERKYLPNKDFYYLTGFDEPNAVCLLTPEHKEHKFVLFVRAKDEERERWTGRRAGVEGAKQRFGADEAYPIDKLDEELPKYLSGTDKIYYRMDSDEVFNQKVVNLIKRYRPHTLIDTGKILHEMRLFKSRDELNLMRKAAAITEMAHREAMKAVKPGMYEYELEALIGYTFRQNGAVGPAYPTIVGVGANATILHYTTNNCQIQDNTLVLIDAAAEYQYYDADVTRTIPANGKFSDIQKSIYNIVLEAQLAAIEVVKPGNSLDDFHNKAVQVITEGLVELGLLCGEVDKLIEDEEYKKFYMHNTGHWLGMDSHDVGKRKVDGEARIFEPGMVLTVEPGIYISKDTEDVPPEYWDIGVRIEDDVLVTENGNEVLTDGIPKTVEEIESFMQER
ncbi:TPA: M24 family metallopeptidase [Candidatus Poribacteria bacterium]|nr:M24 family metallopeptidase [Candidatus Poribacteria bacterium]